MYLPAPRPLMLVFPTRALPLWRYTQHILVCPFARRGRVFRIDTDMIDTDIWPAPCVITDPTSCAQWFAFAGKQKTRVVRDAL